MPTIAQSQINTSRLSAPIAAPTHATFGGGMMMPVVAPVSTLMSASLPVFASGTDRDGRQFFRTGFPQRRFLPVAGLL